MKDKLRAYCILGLASLLFLCTLSSHSKETKPKLDEKKILADFAKAYAAKNKPRLTISVNRELGSEFTEYKVSSRTEGEVMGKLQVGNKEQTIPAASGTGVAPAPRNLLPGKAAAEAKPEKDAKPKAKGKVQEKPAEGKSEEKAAAKSEPETKPEPAAESKPAESKDQAKTDADAKADAKPVEDKKAETAGEKKAESAETTADQAKTSENPPETSKSPEKGGKSGGTDPEKIEKAAVAKDEKKGEPESADKKSAAKNEISAKADAEKSEKPAAAKDDKKGDAEAAGQKPSPAKAKSAQEAGEQDEDAEDEVAEEEDDEDYEDIDEESEDEPAADAEAGGTVAVGMKFESVEIRSELPSAERESFFSEGMLWKFQNAFMNPFLEAKAKIVDRATIVRQAGLEELKGKSIKEIDRVAIEMNALNKSTDLCIEILITKDLNSASGYAFKADAKDLKSGEIIAYATHEGIVKEETKTVILNPTTGKSVKKKMLSLDIEATARNIAFLLMQGMTNSWSE